MFYMETIKPTWLVKPAKGRLWEIDFLRGIAVVMMIVFHFLYDLNYFAGHSLALWTGFWWIFARATATIFVFLVGISLHLSYSRAKVKLSESGLTRKYVKRGFRVFGWGLLITGLTWLLLGGVGTIWFGVLHLIGISIILARPLLKYRMLNLILGLVFVVVGLNLATMVFGFPWLLPLGLMPASFYTLDYTPILPWFGIVLLGLFTGKVIYPVGRLKTRKKPRPAAPRTARPVCFIGMHSLLIYLLHQPVLIGLIHLIQLIQLIQLI